MRARSLVVLHTAIWLCACSESPFAPAPAAKPACGAADNPCPFSCQLDCAARAAAGSAGCVLNLEGTLDTMRSSCSFADGSRVVFRTPLPVTVGRLATMLWDFSIERAGNSCLDLRMEQDQPEAGWLRRRTSLSYPGGSFQQDLWTSTADARVTAGAADRAEVRCPDGRSYGGPAADCSRCTDARACTVSGLLQVQVTGTELIEFTLLSGQAQTTMFTCR